MSTMSPPSPPRFLTADELYRISVDLYQYLIELGRIGEDDRVELLDGVIVKKMTRNPPHLLCVDLCRKEVEQISRDGFWLRSEGPLRIPPVDMPEPDLAVHRGNLRDYANRLPTSTDTVLVIEVADTSLARDRGLKRDLYARAGIPTYWIVDLNNRCVEVFEKPKAGAYSSMMVVPEEDAVELIVDGRLWGRIDVAAILP